jgi:hypothetical protein
MRKLTLALAIGLLVASTGTMAGPSKVAASSYQAKVVIVVGQTQSATARYRSDADQAAAVFAQYTTNIVKIYSPNATWSAVRAAAKGANILVYLGHGSGYPNPYLGYLQPNGDNGMGLDGPTAGKTYYYGENYMAQLGLAPNAVVILNHLCYASGNNESGAGNPSVTTAHTRIDGYASGFIRGGARAVIVEGLNDISYYIDTLFAGHRSVDAMWKGAPTFNNNVVSWPSTRNPGFTSESDPGRPASDGDIYYRSMVSIPSTSTDNVISGQSAPFSSKVGSFYPIAPTRVVDTRPGHEGPIGSITAGGGYYYQIAGVDNIPSAAIAVTANITVTGQTSGGWLYLGPSVDSLPTTSTINFPKGDNRANGITVALSPQGTIGAWYGAGAGRVINLIIDVTGYFLTGSSGAGYTPFGPSRVLDTRAWTGNIGLQGKFVSGVHRKIQIAGVAGLPASGILAVTGNITVVTPTARGYVSLGPDATDTPSSSTINFPARDIRANNVVVMVNGDGTLSAVYMGAAAGASVDLLLDISGYFTASGGYLFNTLDPARILDSRFDVGLAGAFAAKTARSLQVTGRGGVPSGAVAIAGILTVVTQTAGGFAAVAPSIDASTSFSNLNFPVGDARANGVTVPLASDGKLELIYVAAAGRTAQLLLDVTGYYLGAA